MYLCSTQPKWYTFRLLSGILLRYHLHNNVKKALLDRAEFVNKKLNEYKDGGNVPFDLTGLCGAASLLIDAKGTLCYNGPYMNGTANYEKLSEGLQKFQEEMDKYEQSIQESVSAENRNVDLYISLTMNC